MTHSRNIFGTLLLAVGILCGCTQNDEIINDNKQETTKDNVGVTFRLQSNIAATTRSVEDSHEHVQGTADEYKVNNARVYLFDNPTKLFVKSFLLTGITRNGSDADGNVIYDADKVMVTQGTYDIFVVANSNRVINKNTESEFLADIDSVTYTRAQIDDITAGILMTNRGVANVATVIERNGNNDNVVSIQLERVLARIDVAKSAETFPLSDDGGTQYASVKLDGFYVVNLPKYFYSYRHTAVLTSMDEPDWNVMTNFGNVNDVNGYVIDPYFFSKKIDASTFTNKDKYYENFYGDLTDPKSGKWKAFNAVSATPNYQTTYSLENCALAPAQKNGYSTGVVFKAVLEPFNNVYKLNASGSLELITNKANYPEVLYYYGYKFFDSPEAFKAYINSISTTGQEMFQARKYEKTDDGYRCYYNYWIRHMDNYKPTEMGVMEFGVVRNNLYRLLVTNVSDLGYGGTGTLDDISTDTPDEGEAALKVVLNVKPWIVRDQTNIVL